MRTKRGANGESRPISSDLPSATIPSASDVLTQYENASLEFGGGQKSFNGENVNISEATRKLANELNEFESKVAGEAGKQAAATYNDVSEDAVEALQLQSCRKLRQVRLFQVDECMKDNPY